MEIRIEWSELSEKQLKDIYNYFSSEASPRIAKRNVNKIVERVEVLYTVPFSGQKEELLAQYTEDFRYLIEGNYKLIYWKDNELITIASVFDCRQNPDKLKDL